MIKVSKYEFDSEEQGLSKINALPSVKDEDGKDVPNHKHTIVKLGNIVIEQGEYDADGEEVKAPVLSAKYHVDVLWKDIEETDEDGNVTIDHPYGWKSYAIDLDNEGMHGFMGVSYQENKM
jgi:hypothetical protein